MKSKWFRHFDLDLFLYEFLNICKMQNLFDFQSEVQIDANRIAEQHPIAPHEDTSSSPNIKSLVDHVVEKLEIQ